MRLVTKDIEEIKLSKIWAINKPIELQKLAQEYGTGFFRHIVSAFIMATDWDKNKILNTWENEIVQLYRLAKVNK